MRTRTDVLNEIEQACDQVLKIISDSYDHGQFNELFFEPEFKKWYTKKMDELEVSPKKE